MDIRPLIDANLRSVTVLGLVGTGVIALAMSELPGGFRYAESAAILVIVIITASIVDSVPQSHRGLVS